MRKLHPNYVVQSSIIFTPHFYPILRCENVNRVNSTAVQGDKSRGNKCGAANPFDEMTVPQVESLEGARTEMLKFAENAERFLRRDKAISQECREFIRQSYSDQSRTEFGQDVSESRLVLQKRKRGLPPLGPVLSLDIGQHFDCDQLWEEIEMRNRPLLAHLQRRLASLMLSYRKLEQSQKPSHEEAGRGADEKRKTGDTDSPRRHLVPDSPDASLKLQLHGLRGTGDGENMLDTETEVENDLMVVDGNASAEVETERRGAPRVRFAPGTKGAGAKEVPVGDSDSIEDGFFSLADMEMFADDAEHLANQGKLIASDDEDEANDDSEDDNEENGENNQNGILGNAKSATLKGTQKFRYDDFFDPPNEKLVRSKADKVSRILSSYEDEEENDSSEETPFQASQSRNRRFIEAMEEENIGKKPWQLRGEISAFSRPKDSLLNTEMDFGTTADPKSIMDTDRNETIEDLIRQRIVDGLFDDVISPLPDNYIKEKKKVDELPEISQEKPKESLADIYAREFLGEKERAKDELRTKEVHKVQRQETGIEETDEQKEVNRLFDKLASKLDALSGLHFTPGLAKSSQEMTVNKDIRALSSEEAIPEAVSDENLLTPREVYTVNKRKLTGEIEKTKQERRAAHRRTKRGIKKQTVAKAKAARLMEQANPALAEKRRAEEALRRRGKKIRLALPDPKVTKVKAM